MPWTNVQGGPKNWHSFFLYTLTLQNINRFSKLFHCQKQNQKICNNTVTKDPTTPQVCHYTTLWNVSVLKATVENKTTSVTTHFKKLTAGNDVFIVSYCILGLNCHILPVLHQMFNVFALLLDDALKPSTRLTNVLIVNFETLTFHKVV